MRRSAAGLYVSIFLAIFVSLIFLFAGSFMGAGPLLTVVGAIFLVLGVYALVRALSRRNIGGLASGDVQGAVSSTLQARLAGLVRTYYTKPSSRLCNPAKPSEFDRQMLSLLDSIESGAGDIDAKIETLSSYVRNEGRFQRMKDQYKANMVWRKGDESLPWVAETWQLRTNWARLRLLGPTWATYTMATAWAAPTSGEPTVAAS